ncbi:MAG: Hpt domain-containing protein [Planctomycetes bacterium]|nr:Hpt domain-containing protein [Planctomycetota bacterium]
MKQEDQAQAATVLDIEDLMTRCLGNIEFAGRVLAKFQESGDEHLAELEQAVASQDTEAVAQLAHRLKGASANAAAPGLCARAAEIESAARQRSLREIPARLENLRHEWSRFAAEVPRLDWFPEATA